MACLTSSMWCLVRFLKKSTISLVGMFVILVSLSILSFMFDPIYWLLNIFEELMIQPGEILIH